MQGQTSTCAQCGELFVFSDAERAFFEAKGLVPPKRCRSCRVARRGAREQRFGGGAPKNKPEGRGAPKNKPEAEHETAALDPADMDAEREVGVPAIIE
jgi:hypothetical protein